MSATVFSHQQDLEAALSKVRADQAHAAAAAARLMVAADPENAMRRAESLGKAVSGAAEAAETLSFVGEQAAVAAEAVALRLRAAKVLAERAEASREYLDNTLNLKASIAECYAAMDRRDWDRAAEVANRALKLPNQLTTGDFAAKMVPTSELPDTPPQALAAACDDLAALFVREFDKATEARDMNSVTRYFKLFPLVGHSAQGLNRYSRFIRGVIAGQSRSLLSANRTTDAAEEAPKLYGHATARLFENIASILAQHAPLIEKHYGRDAMSKVVAEIQNEVDAQSGLIIDTWWDERRIDRLLAETKYYGYPILVAVLTSGMPRVSSAPLVETANLSEAAECLDELSMILNRWSLYRAFVFSHWPEAKPALDDSALASKLRDLLAPAFGTLALFVFRRSVEKAIDIDEMPETSTRFSLDSPVVSSMVDDMLYVLNTLLDQVIDTGNAQIRDSVLPSFSRVLESDYLGVLQRRLKDGSPAAARININAAIEARTESFMVNLNNALSTGDYLDKIMDRLREFRVDALVDGQLAPELEKLRTNYLRRANDIVVENSQVLFATHLAPQIRSLTALVFKGNYLMTAAAPESNKGGVFQLQWKQATTPLSKRLHPAIFNRVASHSAGLVAKVLEKWIWSLESRVNELGAIALDRDVGKVIATVSETDYTVRKKFVRVAQIVTLISEEEEDIETVLSEAEIQQARRIRVPE